MMKQDKKQQNNQENKTEKGFWYEMFSSSEGQASSKRVLGAIVLLSCLACTIYMAFNEGITDNIKDLMNVLIITSTALLGITSITSIWKNNNGNRKDGDDMSS